MDQLLYRITLVLTGLVNLGMAGYLLRNTGRYSNYPTYRMTRILTVVWLIAFAIGYMFHAFFHWRHSWPTAASALTATYFHLAAICFSWGYTSLLNPTYLTKRVKIRDLSIYLVGLIAYWTVALRWTNAPVYTLISFSWFFTYAVYVVIVFYRTYNRVSYRMMKMSLGSVGSFVRWMQVCCDLIILFGIGSVAITGIFPNDYWPFVLLLILGIGMFSYMVYSLEKYGNVIDDATKATTHASVRGQETRGKTSSNPVRFLLMVACIISSLTLTSCHVRHQATQQLQKADSLLQVAHRSHDYERIILLADTYQQAGSLSEQKACYWRGYAYSRMRKIRLAEQEWKNALSCNVSNREDLKYYSMTANRLAGLLNMKFDHEGTIRIAIPAMKLLEENDYTLNTDYANLHTFVGSCQLQQGHFQKAANNYQIAYEHYLRLLNEGQNIDDYTSSIIGVVNIVNSYIQMGLHQEAYEWTERFDQMLNRYREHPHANGTFIDKQAARLFFYRSYALEGMGHSSEAEDNYRSAVKTQYAQTLEGQIEATKYLITAHRWQEAADKFMVLDQFIHQYEMKMTLDNIHSFLLPKYLANMGAHRTDTALAVGKWICSALDSAIVNERMNEVSELSTIYDTQQKEKEIMEQKADLSHQRFLSTVMTLVLVIIGFCLFIYFRHQAAMRLESAYYHLEIANARAEESSRIKSEFIQQISHEIRTPLNILSGYTQIITSPDVDLDEASRQDINRQVIENTNRITGLVNKMLELSDARSHTVIEKTDDVLALQIAAEAVSASGIEEAKHLNFDLTISPEVESVMLHTNLQAAVRALSLLLDNARKFTTSPEASLTNQPEVLPTEKKEARLNLSVSENNVQFIVEDTGIGVPVEEANRIFDEFVQLNEYYIGTGIGLTVAQSLARRLGGDIWLDTSYTSGARFVMRLPS